MGRLWTSHLLLFIWFIICILFEKCKGYKSRSIVRLCDLVSKWNIIFFRLDIKIVFIFHFSKLVALNLKFIPYSIPIFLSGWISHNFFFYFLLWFSIPIRFFMGISCWNYWVENTIYTFCSKYFFLFCLWGCWDVLVSLYQIWRFYVLFSITLERFCRFILING